jgi:hypothetical protein
MLFEAFPGWQEFFVDKVEERYKRLKEKLHPEDSSQSHESMSMDELPAPKVPHIPLIFRRTTTSFYGKDDNTKIEVNINLEKKYVWLDIIHLILLIYSCFILTMVIGFARAMPPALLAIDCLCFLESVAFIMFNLYIVK